MQEALDITGEMTELIKLSPRRGSVFQRFKDEIAPQDAGIRVLCPTRWTVKAEALKSIVDNFEVLQNLWEESLEYVKESEMRARIGVSDRMMKFDSFFGVMLGQTVLSHRDNLSRTLQKGDISASEGQDIAKMTVRCLKPLRTDNNFALFLTLMNQLCLEKGRELFGMKVEMLRQSFSRLWKNITAKHISKSSMLFAAQLKTGSDNQGISFTRIWNNYF